MVIIRFSAINRIACVTLWRTCVHRPFCKSRYPKLARRLASKYMRILIAHNRYKQTGGEDLVVATESALLTSHGHTVARLDVDNDHIQGALSRITASFGSIYSPDGKQRMQKAIEHARPDVVHVHNFFPTLSPSVFL